jgi:hypothetical protein
MAGGVCELAIIGPLDCGDSVHWCPARPSYHVGGHTVGQRAPPKFGVRHPPRRRRLVLPQPRCHLLHTPTVPAAAAPRHTLARDGSAGEVSGQRLFMLPASLLLSVVLWRHALVGVLAAGVAAVDRAGPVGDCPVARRVMVSAARRVRPRDDLATHSALPAQRLAFSQGRIRKATIQFS